MGALMLFPLRCKHVLVECIHDDEIIAYGWRRVRCLDCGRALRGALPNVCSFTGLPHRGDVGYQRAWKPS